MSGMAAIPVTSISLLRAISSDTDSVRWAEFLQKYEYPMRGFLKSRFPSVEPEDAMQETLIALTKALPNYHYTPDSKGHFRNYLMGILSHKAADILSRNTKLEGLRAKLRDEPPPAPDEYDEQDDAAWKMSAMETAIEQLMSDTRIRSTTREVFRHAVLMHEPPEDVARAFGIARNNVDQIKSRMIAKLAEMIRAMTDEVTAS